MDQPLPGVSIVKTCFRAEDNEEKNFEVLFHQDYPGPIQILFVVSNESDPIVPLIRKFLARFPKADAQLVVSKTRNAFWKKVDALYDAHQSVRYDHVIWSDSDVILKENYLTQMVASLQEPGVSVVTTPQYDARANNFASALKVLGNNSDVATHLMIFDCFVKWKRVGFGQSLGFRKSEFDQMGRRAWNTMNTFLADDQALPFLFYKEGKRVVFRNIYCPVEFSNKSFENVLRQKIRWLLPQKMAMGNPFSFLLSMFAYPVIVSALMMIGTQFSMESIQLFVASCLSRFFVSFVFEILVLKDYRMTLRYFWTIPIWDIMHLFFFVYGFFKNTIQFENRKFKVVDRFFVKEIVDQTKESASGHEETLVEI
jgi:ceramide glucosyltransferase